MTAKLSRHQVRELKQRIGSTLAELQNALEETCTKPKVPGSQPAQVTAEASRDDLKTKP